MAFSLNLAPRFNLLETPAGFITNFSTSAQ